MKKFIFTSPFQPKDKLKKSVYKAVDNQLLIYDKPVSFPVIPVINAYAEEGEEIEVIAAVSKYKNAEDNYDVFKEQLSELCNEKNIRLKNNEPTKKSIEYNELLDTQLDTFKKLIDCVEDGDTLYVCMSYGSKAVPIVQMMALNYAYKVHKDISIGCVVYGNVDFNTGDMNIYDITSLFYMNQIVDIVAEMETDDPAGAIKALLQ